MTGLNLESFLHLLRADVGAWVTLGLIAVVLALMAWTSWGSRRALRKCLVLSVIAHFGLALYGGTVPGVMLAIHPDEIVPGRDRIRQIKVITPPELAGPRQGETSSGGTALSRWDQPLGTLALADARLSSTRSVTSPEVPVRPGDRDDLKTAAASPDSPPVALSGPESRPIEAAEPESPPRVTPGGEDEVAPAVVAPRPEPAATSLPGTRLRPDRSRPSPLPPPVRPRPASNLTTVPATPEPPADPSAPGLEAPTAMTAAPAEPAPTAVVEIGSADVAPVEVIASGSSAPRISAGDANLRTRSRPRTANPPLTSPRTPLAMAMRPASERDGSAVAPDDARPVPLADRPSRPESVDSGPQTGETRPPSTVEGDAAVADVVKEPTTAAPRVVPPETDIRRRSRPSPGPASTPDLTRRPAAGSVPLALVRVNPGAVPALPEIRGATGGRPLADVPEVYRSRLDPNRSARAFRSGASPASEQAVERALDWLARHQDADGRWDGGTSRYDDGTPVKGDDDFTVHCPPGETCFGECNYAEADTALTGLALLSYLGAGYTQTDGKYAETVSRGLNFLLSAQKPDGDLRGTSRAVGMYCHAMATIALCEAYALTGEERLRSPVERAVGFLVRSRARDGLAWRYAPGAPVGDTSILGWVVMALKSAHAVGIAVPSETHQGTLTWLSRVSSGGAHGLARYQPWDNVTPTMTAEAWVCRQFLGVGGPGPASSEAAQYLLSHGPRTDTYNLYYWYYGTLAMYQHGGDSWYRWNAEVRDEIVRRQVVRGHSAGSWAPDESQYGAKGGRIYGTALATLSLEVYYRYLRLYDDPKIPPAVAPRPRSGERDPALGRLGTPARRETPKR